MKGEQRLNSCHNRPPYADTLRVQEGWVESGPSRVAVMTEVPFRMTPGCVYSTDQLIGQLDQGCDGCRWRQTP